MRRSKLEAPQITAILIDWTERGVTQREMARRLLAEQGIKVTAQAIAKFQARHDAEIQALNTEVAVAVKQLTIRDKIERIEAANEAWQLVRARIRDRGLFRLITTYKKNGDIGKTEEVFDVALAKAIPELGTYVAKELGEFQPENPPPPPERRNDVFSTLVIIDGNIRELAQHLFAAMGARDAGGLGPVREQGPMAALAAPDDGERRTPADSGG